MAKKLFSIGILFTFAWIMGFSLMAPIALAADPAPTPSSGQLQSEEFMFDLGVITHKEIKKANWIEKGINYVAERVIGVLAGLAGSIAVLMMTIGGFRMITSAGGEGYDKGKSMMLKAAIGLVFVLGAYLIVTTVQILIKSIYAS